MSEMINLVYIPLIHISYDDCFIRKTFQRLDLGIIENIYSFNHYTPTSQFYSAMVCFSYWNINNPAAVNLAEKILNDNMEARLIYDDPKYWILLPSFPDNYIDLEVASNIEYETIKSNVKEINSLTNIVDNLSEENFRLEYKIKELEGKITPIIKIEESEPAPCQGNPKRFKKYCMMTNGKAGRGMLSSVSNWHKNPKIVRNFVIHKEFKPDYKEIVRTSFEHVSAYNTTDISEAIKMKSDDKNIYKEAHYWCLP